MKNLMTIRAGMRKLWQLPRARTSLLPHVLLKSKMEGGLILEMISELKDSVALAEARKILEAAGAAMVMKLEEVLMRMKMLMKLEEVLMRMKKRNNSMIALTVNMRRRMQIRKIRGVRPTGMMRI
jgi:hypothetical protein